MNHPENPTPLMLDSLWLAAMAGDEDCQRQYWACLKVATYRASVQHLRSVQAKQRARRGF